MIKRLQTEFIPVVGNTHELQNGRSPARDWFMKMATSVNPRVTQGHTSQGFYIAAPDGTAYGFNNNRTVDRVSGFMDQAVAKWRANPGAKVDVSQNELDAPFSRRPENGTAVVRVYSRIKPLPEGCDELNRGVGRDHFWVYPDEIAELEALAAKKGSAEQPLPSRLAARLARFHLVDNVRGEPNFWTPEEVRKAVFTVRPVKPGLLKLAGSFAMANADGTRGLEGAIEGELALKAGKLSSFRAFARTAAWGAGTYTPRPPAGKFPVLFAFQVVNDEAARLVPPQGNLWGNEYREAKLAP